MPSTAADNAKAFAEEQLALLRVKLNQIPALQEVEVRECDLFLSRDLNDQKTTVSSIAKWHKNHLDDVWGFDFNSQAIFSLLPALLASRIR